MQDIPSGAISLARSKKGFPNRVESSYPVDSGSLSPAEYKSISPAKFRGYSHKSLTGLSSASCNWKIIPSEVLSIPSGVHHQNPQQSLSTGSPVELSLKSQQSISSLRSNSPQSNLFIKFIPQRSHLLLQVYSFIIPSGSEEFNIILQQLWDLLSPAKTSHFHTSWYMHMRIISYNLIYSWEHLDIIQFMHHDIAYS